MNATTNSMHTGRYNYIHHGMRFCEHCHQYKPRGNRPASKAWKCDDCMKAKTAKGEK